MNTQTFRAAALCLVGFALVAPAKSAELTLPNDGWASWEVEAVEDAPAWCCWSNWDARAKTRTSCKLDKDNGNFGSRDEATTDTARIYARVTGAKVERLRVLSASCQVEAATPIRNLENVTTDDSARFLVALSKGSAGAASKHDLGENVLAALAMHRGDLAQNALAALARADAHSETRKKAVFWLAMLRGEAGAEVTSSVMFNDKDPELRRHAAFALTQSKSARIAEDLIRQGNTDTDGDVRAQAWFWLAQSEVPGAEAAIAAALRKDQDDHVREQAIFALSQLPDDRATRALIAAAEDRSLSHEQRKRAVFWLSQSESDGAQKYLEQVLAGNSTR
jgi:HEAT repeat protein